jgi:CBS domain-containing protein
LFPNDFGLIIALPNTVTFGEVFQKLIQHQIQSIPIIHPLTGKPLYVLSIAHVMQTVINHFSEVDFKDDIWGRVRKLFFDTKDSLQSKTLAELEGNIDFTRDPAHTISDEATLLDAVQIMVRTQCHRVVVMNKSGDIVNIITQSRIVQLLATMADILPYTDRSLEELGIAMKGNVMVVRGSETAYLAFKRMFELNVSGLAVVNEKGALIGNISATDIKLVGYKPEFWTLLGKSVTDYLKEIRYHPEAKVRPGVFSLLHDEAKGIVVKCKPINSFGYVIRLISYYRVHKLYVVDDNLLPVGVVSLYDILSIVMSNIVQ